MKVGWLIDAELFEAYRDDLIANIRSQGHEAKLIRAPSPPYRWDDAGCSYRETFPKDACVVTHGDIELVTRIRQEQRWTPGAFATVENFKCSNYFCHFGEHLLSRNYIMLPFGELRRCKNFLLDTVGQEGRVFVRPDSPLKLFTGQVISADTYDADLEYLGFYEFPVESLVAVSTPRTIELEWRFVVANRRVIAGSQYKCRGKNDVQPHYDEIAMELAARIATSDYQPDRVWVMDICRTSDDTYHLLEIGGFSFCDLYSCDKSAIVTEVSHAAVLEWEESRA